MAASTAFTGEHGTFTWTGITLAAANSPNILGYANSDWGLENVYSWTLTESAPALDTTIFQPDGGATDAVYGLVTTTGTVNLYLCPNDIVPTADRWVGSGTLTSHITDVLGEASAQTWTGNFLVTRATTTVPVNGVTTVSLEIQNKGKITRTVG